MSAAPANTERILVVDDEPEIVALVAYHLAKAGYRVATASSGQDALALEPFAKIRRAVGDRMDIMVEFHSLWSLPMAKKLARILEPYNPTWYEDPIRMNSPQALAEAISLIDRSNRRAEGSLNERKESLEALVQVGIARLGNGKERTALSAAIID